MARGEPEETDKAIREIWRQRLGRWPAESSVPRYSDHGYEGERVTAIEPAPFGDGILAEALLVATRPASPETVTSALARLRAVTAHRKTDGMDAEAWFTAVADELENYPADVVRQACRDDGREEKWLPSLKDLILRCDRAVRYRRLLRKALEAAK